MIIKAINWQSAAMASIVIALAMPGTKASFYIDTIGSVIVSLYMIYCGIRTIKEFNR